MARFTVEDCVEKIDNIFTMTLIAAVRARQIEKSGQTLIPISEINNDKPTVLALREIALGLVDRTILTNFE